MSRAFKIFAILLVAGEAALRKTRFVAARPRWRGPAPVTVEQQVIHDT